MIPFSLSRTANTRPLQHSIRFSGRAVMPLKEHCGGVGRGASSLLPSRGGSGCFVSEQAKLACLRTRLCAIVHPQFAENITHMAFDGLDSNHQCLRNLIVGVAS